MKRAFLAALLAATGASTTARAVTLAEWDVAAANAGTSDLVQVAAAHAEVAATPLVAHGALAPGFSLMGTFEYVNWPSGPAPDPTKYYELSITPDAGRSIQYELMSLAVGSAGSNTGAFQVTASSNGFATPGLVVATRTFPKDVQWHAFDLDLSALGTQAGTVTFRFSMYLVGNMAFSGLGANPSPNFGNQGRNLEVTGTVIQGPPPPGCVSSATTLCIDDVPGDRRFQARVAFETTQGQMPAGPGRAIPLNSLGIPSGGIFWFTSSQNPEMLLKVLNGCSFNNHYWVFYAAGTNFALRTEVVDTATGRVWVRTNPDRTQAPPVGDIVAFPCTGQALVAGNEGAAETTERATDLETEPTERLFLDPREACVANATTLCIDHQPGDRRFEATVFFSTTQGSQPTGFGNAIPLTSLGVPSGGVFWFTSSQNPEMLLKVLNGCSFNNHFWVFYAAGTNFALEVEVTDTATGEVWRSVNPDRRQAPPIGDITAFPCEGP